MTLAGWVSLPVNSGAGSRDYVYGICFNNVTAHLLGTALRKDAGRLLPSG